MPENNVSRRPHPVRPLPFDGRKLDGISERMIVSHHENNYGGAVKNLNKVEEELSRVTKDTPGFVVAGLKERELSPTRPSILHRRLCRKLGGPTKAQRQLPTRLAGR